MQKSAVNKQWMCINSKTMTWSFCQMICKLFTAGMPEITNKYLPLLNDTPNYGWHGRLDNYSRYKIFGSRAVMCVKWCLGIKRESTVKDYRLWCTPRSENKRSLMTISGQGQEEWQSFQPDLGTMISHFLPFFHQLYALFNLIILRFLWYVLTFTISP